jgi:DNA-binding protein HU-beta
MMSKKITFGELIAEIAEETNNSKQFTRDFLKDFADVINDGLDEDGKVNIAGFGKFKLRRVDEREGRNPQTGEKITIAAHNKIVFKPYKSLRENVNAPFLQLEPELLGDQKGTESATKDTEAAEEQTRQNDFIPTAPPTSRESLPQSGNEPDDTGHTPENESDTESAVVESDSDLPDSNDGSSDVVEFTTGDTSPDEEKADNTLNEFLGLDDTNSDSPKEQEDKGTGKKGKQSKADKVDEPDNPEKVEQEIKESENKTVENQEASNFKPKTSKSNTGSTRIVAAAVILLIIISAGAAWYFSTGPNVETQYIAANKIAASAKADKSKDSQNNSSEEDQQAQSSATKQQVQATKTPASTNSDTEKHNIQKGQTLWSLAEEKYGNPRLWPWIYGTNERLEDPDLILAGNSLAVPLPSGPDKTLNNADSVGVAKGYIQTYRWYKNNQSSKAANHLWAAKIYHDNIRDIADVKIDKADLTYANQAR